MAIFKDNVDGKYDALINVFFGDAHGKLDNDASMQKINDFRVLGIAYLQNAEIVLDFLLEQDPRNGDASAMILPVFFNIWHGLELMLKCGNMICDEYLSLQNQKYTKHTIDVYADLFLEKTKKLGIEKAVKDEFFGVADFIDECNKYGAHFDFARYTMQSNGQSQFYNKPNNVGVIPVVGVDVLELACVLTKINYKFVIVIDFLRDMIFRHGKENKQVINESALKAYIEHESVVKFVGDVFEPNLEVKAMQIREDIEKEGAKE